MHRNGPPTRFPDHPQEMETTHPMEQTQPRSSAKWTFIITAIALLMVVLDNLVVSTALPTIKNDLHATLEGLEWIVNAYTLTFAVMLLPRRALGDRFGRRRMFVFGLALFTLASAGAALSTSIETLIVARAIQGTGAAFVVPLTLTLLSAAVPAERRGVALGAWGAIGGLAVALGPVGRWHHRGRHSTGTGSSGSTCPSAWCSSRLATSASPRAGDPRTSWTSRACCSWAPASSRSSGAVVKGNELGWTSTPIVISMAIGIVLLIGFAFWERRTAAPMLPLYFFKSRAFSMANLASLLMYFGMFGSIFLLTQYLQIVLGNSPFQAGVRDPALDAGADLHRTHRGRLVRQGRRRVADGRRPRDAGRRPRLAGPHRHAHGGLRADGHPVHHLGHRHGPVLRTGRQRRAERRPTQGRGTGIGCQ